MINKNSPMPLYYQVKEVIIENIKKGTYEVNKSIPTELELQQIFDVSRTTVRQAISELISEGYLYRKRGIGTFVADQSLNPSYDFFFPAFNTSELIKLSGKTVTKKIIKYDKIIASQEICDILAVRNPTNVYVFYRVEYGDGNPVSITRTYIPCDFVPNFKEDIKEIESNFHGYLDRKGYPIEILDGSIEAHTIYDEFTLSTLNLNKDDSAIVMKMINRLRNSTPIEYSRTILNCKAVLIPIRGQRIPTIKD